MARQTRRRVVVVATVLFLLKITAGAGAQPAWQSIIDEQVRQLPTGDIESFLRALDPEVGEHIPPLDFGRLAAGDATAGMFQWQHMWSFLTSRLVDEVYRGSRLLFQLIILAAISAFVRVLSHSALSDEVANVALFITMLIVIFVGLQAFHVVLGVADRAITDMVSFMYAMLPVMITLLAAVGGVTSAAVFHPLLVTAILSIASIVRTFLFPIALLGVTLTAVSTILDHASVQRLAAALRQGVLTVLGLLFIVFMGVLSVRGVAGPVLDGLGIKTAKFLAGTFIPIVGSRLADAVEVVARGSLLLKNAMGVFGLAVVFMLAAFPAIKIAALLVIFRVTAFLVEPLAESRISGAMAALGDGAALVLACVLTTALMFFIAFTALLVLGNMTVVMR